MFIHTYILYICIISPSMKIYDWRNLAVLINFNIQLKERKHTINSSQQILSQSQMTIHLISGFTLLADLLYCISK